MTEQQERARVLRLAERDGFELCRTGGNCEALLYEFPDAPYHYILLTDAGDPSLPTLAAPVFCGLYDGDEETSEPLTTCTFHTLYDALECAREWAEDYLSDEDGGRE